MIIGFDNYNYLFFRVCLNEFVVVSSRAHFINIHAKIYRYYEKYYVNIEKEEYHITTIICTILAVSHA